jgi:hypothetical protein
MTPVPRGAGVFLYIYSKQSISKPMFRSSRFLQKQFFILFLVYGLPFAGLMYLLEIENLSFYQFLFYFIFQGGFMAYFTIYFNNKSLQKEGIDIFDEVVMNENQERQILTSLDKEEFYDFWKNSKEYKVVQSSEGSFDVNKRYYTTEFKAIINVSYVDVPEPRMLLKSKPKKVLINDLALIHRTIDSVRDYILKKELDRMNV